MITEFKNLMNEKDLDKLFSYGDRIIVFCDFNGERNEYTGLLWAFIEGSNTEKIEFIDVGESLATKKLIILEYIVKVVNKTKNKTYMSLKEKFILSKTPEPEKTLREVGILNGDGIITEEGKTILLSWLAQKFAKELKEEVADKMKG